MLYFACWPWLCVRSCLWRQIVFYVLPRDLTLIYLKHDLIMICCSLATKFFTKLSVNIELASLASLHLAQNYPSSASKTLQSWCRVLKVFYQTSLLPLCNVFCHIYERNLKLLEIDNISSAWKHEQKSSNKLFHFHFPSSNGCIMIMFPNKFVAAIIGS